MTSGEDAPPLRLPLPPWTPLACSRQERTGLSERQRSARTRGSHAIRKPWFALTDCSVGTAFCGYATNEVDRDASMLSCRSNAAEMHRRAHTRARTQTHTCTGTHTQARARTQTHAQVHIHTHAQAHTRIGAHTHRYTCTCTQIIIHTHTHALSIAPKQHAKLAHACRSSRNSSSSSSSGSNKSKSGSGSGSNSSLSLWEVKVATHKLLGLQKLLERGWLLNATVK